MKPQQRRATQPKNLAALGVIGLFGQEYNQPQAPQILELPDVLVDTRIVRAVYPCIRIEDFAITMQRYRAYIQIYNDNTEWENIDIFNHNMQVKIYLQRSEKVTAVMRAYAGHFPNLNKDLNDRDYNTAAAKVCDEHGPIILKRKIQTVKPTTELFFQNMLHLYNNQMCARNKEYIAMGATAPRPLQGLSLHSWQITQLQRQKDVLSLSVCGKSVRNHRDRLEEAGVFFDYTYRGWQRAVQVAINPQILQVYDIKTDRVALAKNQSVTPSGGKEFPHNNEITRPYKEKYKDKDGAAQPFFDKEQAEPASSLHYKGRFTETSSLRKVEISPVAAPAPSVKVVKRLAEKAADLIQHPQELAEDLAAGMYANYTPIPLRDFEKLAFGSKMTESEFRELFIQDHFKQSAKMYRTTTPFVGSWKKAINHWSETKFLTFNGHPLSKEAIVKQIPQYRYRLDRARRWFIKNKRNPLYPGDYFDTTRKTTAELGFEGTANMWVKHVKYLAQKPVADLNLKKAAAERAQRIKNTVKFDKEVKRFLKNKITQPQLFDYVRNNLPPMYLVDLPAHLKKLLAPPVPKYEPIEYEPLPFDYDC